MTDIFGFESFLFQERDNYFRHPEIDVIGTGFRPVGGKPKDFCVIEHEGRHHFFYIETKLQEATAFYPGNEIYFGHASTGNFLDWEVHDPVMLIRPGTWEESHVWAPFILKHNDEFIMAYTGVNRRMSQNIGLASSKNLFDWTRWETNPISPCTNKAWARWSEDSISSCRDPHLVKHDGRIWLAYTANTVHGETCIALSSTADLLHWEDHGPIIRGPRDGYEPRFSGGHVQGSMESPNLFKWNGKWYLMLQFKKRDVTFKNWIFESDRIDSFDFSTGREFWKGAYTVEIVKTRGSRSLLACTGPIRFGVVDWNDALPEAQFVTTAEQLASWNK